jgi:hypothetical protein
MSEIKEKKEHKFIRKVDYKKLNENKEFCNEQIIQEVSEKMSIPYAVVKSVAEAQSKFTSDTIRGGGLETIVMPYLGKFKVAPKRVQILMRKGLQH